MKAGKVYLTLFIILMFTGNAAAQFLDNDISNRSFFGQHWNDIKKISKYSLSPKYYQNWKLLSYAGITSLFILGTDMHFHEEWGIEKEYARISLPNALSGIGNIYDKPGTLYFTLGLTGVMYGSGKLFGDRKLVQTTNLMVRSLLITGLFTAGLKAMIGRARPYVADNPHKYKPFTGIL